jgi:hypothetical protein
LPKYKALVLGKWNGMLNEEEALSGALERREVTYDDFTQEKGWTPATDSNREASGNDIDSRLDYMDGAVNVYIRKALDEMAKESK